MNDPNGLVWHKGRWHLCYQYAPEHVRWDPGMHWGHAIAHDLSHWEHWPIALYPDELGAIFSGSAAVRQATGGGGELVACFTHAGEHRQIQSLAFSSDEGRTWKKYEGNPVLKSERHDFRDPKIFRYGSEWRMIVAAGDEAQIYRSSDLIEWTFLSAFPSPFPDSTWECPDLIEISGRWILLASLIIPDSLPKDGSTSRYWLGAFDGRNFIAASGPHRLSLGPDDYAAVSWNNAPNERRVIVGWMNHWSYANNIPTQDEGWRGIMTMPRVLSLDNYTLRQAPPEEFLERRRKAISLTGEATAISGKAFEIEVELDLAQLRTAEVSLTLRNDAEETLQITYNQESKEICIDRTASGKFFDPNFASVFRASLPLEAGLLRLNIFVDSCSVELFAQGGTVYGAALVFPSAPWRKVVFVGAGLSIKNGAFYSLA
jgi:fructan beta-fructosidase